MKGNVYEKNGRFRAYFHHNGERVEKRFGTHGEAERWLTGQRFKADEGTWDARDYRADNPLGFANLVDKFLHSKRLLKGIKKYEQRLSFGVKRWGNTNIKTIGFAQISELLNILRERGYSSKYIKDIRDVIKSLYRLLYESGEITHDQMPRFPIVKASSPYRKIVGKQTQSQLLDEIRRISWNINPRIYIGILFLATYINVRPGELIGIKEKDIDLKNERILIRESKTGEQKYVYLLEEDIQLLGRLPKSFPELYAFRHIRGRGGNPLGSKFGKGYLYRWWGKACGNLNIKGVSLYGGTRYSTAVALRTSHTPEEIKRATGHRTASAFDRYLEIQGDELRAIYAQARGGVVDIKKQTTDSG